MSNMITVAGHAWRREFFYTTGAGSTAVFHTCRGLGGASQINRLLRQAGVRSQAQDLPETAMREYLEMGIRDGRLLVTRQAGFARGDFLLHELADQPAVIWDEGWGGITPPAEVPILWASNKAMPAPSVMQAMEGRCLLMLSGDVLREAGAMISKQVSWERTATELVWQMKNNTAISHLLYADHILITFGVDGAVYIRQEDDGRSAALTLLHGGGEGTLQDAAGGLVPDSWASMVFQVARRFERVLAGTEALNPLDILAPAGQLVGAGYSAELLAAGDIIPAETGWNITGGRTYAIPQWADTHRADPQYWCISHGFQGGTLYDLAFATVLEGMDRLEGLPRMSFGALTTVDRREIEAYQNIKNLIVGYAAGKSNKPISIAVFGSPGSGKSFGVTQIAKNVLPGRVEKIEFNVSQFAGPEDLTRAFHRIRDLTLAGKLPLVFFDEFDSDRDGRALGWLKSFLMPMQDGKFKDGPQEHPVGRSIFVFAGGTASSFDEFCAPMNDPHRAGDFKGVKGPDFVSRLRGTINVLGPNPADGAEQNFILRRALLLRSFCERRFSAQIKRGEAFIDHNVLRAMLLIPKYLHGARSMESVLDMSRIEGPVWDAAELPFRDQLALHVDADAFMRLVLRDVTLTSYIEDLAKAIHQRYLEQATTDPRTDDPALEPWETLHESLRRSNIRQAISIERKLRAVGCAYDAGDTPYPTVEAFSEAEIDLLSRMEHDLWVKERIADGWVPGEKDVANKITPYLVPWEELEDNVKTLDRDTVENIIPLLQSIGLRVYRKV